MSDSLLTEEEVKTFLGIDRPQIERLRKQGKLTAYRVGGAYLRFRKDQVVSIRSGKKFQVPDQFERGAFDHLRDFIRFNGIYFLMLAGILLLVFYFLKS